MHLLVAQCEVTYAGRLDAFLPRARRVIMHKADGSILIHADGGSYKPLNWMSPPCTLAVRTEIEAADIQAGEEDQPPVEIWQVEAAKTGDKLIIRIFEKIEELRLDLGIDPGLQKDGVEAHLQKLLAEQVHLLGEGYSLIRREYPTPIGPVDLLVYDSDGLPVAVEVKRRGEIDGVEQLLRYLELLRRQPEFSKITGIFAAQEIKRQARVWAEDNQIRCVVLDYDAMRGVDDSEGRLF